MGVKEYWLIEETLMQTYAHLVDSYSEKVKNEWKKEVIKVEDSQAVDIEGGREMKQEDADDSTVFHSVYENCTTNAQKVNYFHRLTTLTLTVHSIEICLNQNIKMALMIPKNSERSSWIIILFGRLK